MIKVINIIKNGVIAFSSGEMDSIDANNWYFNNTELGSFGPENEYSVEEIDVTDEVTNRNIILEKITIGKTLRDKCQDVLDLIAGYNSDRNLSFEQISSMQVLFHEIELALRAGRPNLAKSMIQNIIPDNVLVTQEMKDYCLGIL